MADLPELSEAEKLRYSRHLMLPEVGDLGQRRLKAGKVLVVGAGGLGCPVILYLCAAGVGTVGIVDYDAVEASNLQRQIMYTTADVGAAKTGKAAMRAGELNPEVLLIRHDTRLSQDNVLDIVSAYDVVVDGSDNFTTRYLVNDACVLAKKPNVYGSIYRFEGQASVFDTNEGPCYRCLFPEPPPAEAIPNCAEGGVLGAVAGVIGAVQACEALKILLGAGSRLYGRLLLFDALAMRFDTLLVKANKDCPVCGDNPTIKAPVEVTATCLSAVADQGFGNVTAVDLHGELQQGRQPVLLDVRTVDEYRLGHLDNAVHIPLRELPDRLAELKRDSDLVVYCRSGNRSRTAAEILAASGFTQVRNLVGGITAWSKEVDASIAVG